MCVCDSSVNTQGNGQLSQNNLVVCKYSSAMIRLASFMNNNISYADQQYECYRFFYYKKYHFYEVYKNKLIKR